jgi:hypothetical protein
VRRAAMRAVVLFVVVLASVADAGTRQPSKTDEEHLAYGSLFTSVAKLHCVRQVDSAKLTGSCVMISPTVAVTAAHVVEGTCEWHIECGNQRATGIEVSLHPRYNRVKKGACDVAVVRLRERVLLDYYPALYSDSDEVGKVISLAGHGLTGTMDVGYTISDGKRRAGSNTIGRCEDGVLVCVAGMSPTQLEYCISPGDSGGGLFIGRYLAGVHSYTSARGTTPPKSTYGNESAHTRISSPEVRGWLMEFLEE